MSLPGRPKGEYRSAQHEGTPVNPCLLAFDTSTEQLAVGLWVGGAMLSYKGPGGALASMALLPQIHSLMAQAGVSLSQLDAIAFGRGPGAFTGLRTSCAVAQGLALGTGCPVLPLDSLLIVAEDARAQQPVAAVAAGFDIVVAMDARMNEVYAARYRWQSAQWSQVDAPALVPLATLNQSWSGRAPQWVAGSALAAFGERLQLPCAAQPVPQEQDRCAALLRLAARAYADGAAVAADQALPLYLRDKVALTIQERVAARAAAGAAS